MGHIASEVGNTVEPDFLVECQNSYKSLIKQRKIGVGQCLTRSRIIRKVPGSVGL